MKKILFLIHDLGEGGAEKVLLNLVNNMDQSKFDITVMTLFDYGVNRQFIAPHIKYKTWCKKMFRGNSHLMKLFTPEQLYKMIIKDHYDVVVSYLEGPTARVVSGCSDNTTKIISWIHCTFHSRKELSNSFRSMSEANKCYNKLDKIIFVSEEVKKDFLNTCDYTGVCQVLNNTNESDVIINKSNLQLKESIFDKNIFYWCGMGKITSNKGFDRMIRIQKKLVGLGYNLKLIILGDGPLKQELEKMCKDSGIIESVIFKGYQKNPYNYLKKCDLFVCASHSEGFSTAATEALIVGTPVCTVDVSGMKEMLGENNEYGVVVENDEEALYKGIKKLLDDKHLLEYYKQQALERGKMFSTEKTVKAVEDMLMGL